MDNSPRKTLRVCRICSTKMKLELLFLHRPRDVVQMITGFAKITIEKTDELPQHICKKCIRKVNECHEFKIQCEKADKKFRDALKEPPPEPKPEPEKEDKTKIEPVTEEAPARPKSPTIEEKPPTKNEFHEITIKCEPTSTVYEPEYVEIPEETHIKSSDGEDSDDDDDRVDLISQEAKEVDNSKSKEETNSQETNSREPNEMDYDSSESEDFQFDERSDNDDDDGDGEGDDEEDDEKSDTEKEDHKRKSQNPENSKDSKSDGETNKPPMVSQKKQRRRKKPLTVSERKEMVQCRLCLKYYSKDVIKQHKPKHTENDPLCTICKIYETSDRTLRRHIKAVHNLNPRTMLPVDPMECKVCFKIFYNYLEFWKHQGTHRKKFECSTCHLTFDQIIFLKHHEKKHIGQAKDGGYACEICGIVCSQRVNLRRHYIQMHSNEKPYSCEVCSKAYATKEGLNRHATIHMEKSHVCHICGKAYSCNINLNVHIKSHDKVPQVKHPNSIYKAIGASRRYIYYRKCPVCNRDVAHSNFKIHMMAHTGERPYKCDQCGKGFLTSQILNGHMKIHSDVKPYKCDDCESTFRLYRQLKAHKRAHCDVQYHHCRFCDKQFAHKGNCIVHERTHTGDRPFVCEVCGEGYCNSTGLKRHKRRRHNITD